MGRCTLLRLEPEGRIGFPRGAEENECKTLKIENTSENDITWKVRTTGPKTFLVNPRAGVLKTGESTETTLTLIPNIGESDLRLQVQATALKDGCEKFAREDWRCIPRSSVEQSELSVYFLGPSRAAPDLLGQPPRQQELGSNAGVERDQRGDEGLVPVFSQPAGGYERSLAPPAVASTRCAETEGKSRGDDEGGLPREEEQGAASQRTPASGINTAAFDARFGGPRPQAAIPSEPAARPNPTPARREVQDEPEEAREGVWHRPPGVQRNFGNSAASRSEARGGYGESRSDHRGEQRGSQFVNSSTQRQRAQPAAEASTHATGPASRAKVASAKASPLPTDGMNPMVKVLLFVLVAVLMMNLYLRPLAEQLAGGGSSSSAEAAPGSATSAPTGGSA